jgi:uncharacterized RDD family membrane protein YckC
MDEENVPSGKPAVPPPDLPKPPPPDLPKAPPPDLPKPAGESPPPVNVKIREAKQGEEAEEQKDGPAPFNSRMIAVLIDVVVSIGLQIGVLWILPGFAERIAWLAGAAYFVTRDSLPFLGGQSVGKKAMKLRALSHDGKSLMGNWEAALIRNGVLLIPFFALIELFVLLSREEKPGRGIRLGDEWARTKVMVVEEPARDDDP